MAFHMTPAAAGEILAAAARSGAAGMALRLAAAPAGDGGMAFRMGFDERAEEDEVAVFEGLTVLIGAGSSPWLADAVLDYVQIESGAHDFILVQPTASTGGCGSGAGCGGGRCGTCG